MTISLISFEDTISNQSFITPWSFIHLLSGLVMQRYFMEYSNYSRRKRYIITIVLHTIYELKDIYRSYIVKDTNCELNPDCRWFDNSILNSVGDTISCLIGQYIAEHYFKRVSLFKLVSILLVLVFVFSSVVKLEL